VDVRAWWRVRHPPPSLAQRLDVAYTTVIVGAIFGAVAYGTAGSALADVLSPERLERFGPPVALVALVLVARWGAFQGPVVFTVPDVAFLLGAPLPRRRLAERRLVLAFAFGAAAGALLAAAMLVGLGDVTAGDAAMLVVAVAELGALGVAAAWAVERSARWERAVWYATWAAVGAAAGLAAWAPGVPGVPLLALLSVATAAAFVQALRTRGDCSAERHLRRAEARQGAVASLGVYDLRTARRSLEGARPAHPRPGGGRLRHLPIPAVAWRDAVSALRAPGRVVEALALSAGAAAVATAEADRPLVVAAAMAAGYIGAARVLWPLRAELDVPDRARVLLRPRAGRVLVEHVIVPASVTVCGAAAGVAAAVVAGHPGAAVAVVTVLVAPALTLCAAMSARRGGRVPQSVLATALAGDPTGGGGAVAGWFAWWPSVAVLAGLIPIALAEAGLPAPAVAWVVAVTATLTWLAQRDVDKEAAP
jgi:uncharacterized membrane protein YfcA